MNDSPEGNQLAPDGMVWRCRKCGKRSLDRYGEQALDRGYDESCMLNAELVAETDAAKAEEGEPPQSWNQPICEACWEKRSPGRVPVRVPAADVETCGYCGRETRSGVYVRDNPGEVPFPRAEPEP